MPSHDYAQIKMELVFAVMLPTILLKPRTFLDIVSN
jgi:hypothetical protein